MKNYRKVKCCGSCRHSKFHCHAIVGECQADGKNPHPFPFGQKYDAENIPPFTMWQAEHAISASGLCDLFEWEENEIV